MSIRHLDALFDPHSVAVVGATDKPSSVGATVWRNLRRGGFAGPCWPVNPGRATVGGEPAFASMQGLAGMAGAPWASQINRDLARNSGNAVFEDYKQATLERLEEERRKLVAEQEAFASFLDDLKRAKDRTEFESFMQERERSREQANRGPGNDTPAA